MIAVDAHVGQEIKGYQFKKLLGKGNFGSVYLVESPTTNLRAACKVIDKARIQEIPKLGELINSQVSVLFNCQNQNVVSYISSFETAGNVYIVMEYCNGGDVDSYCKGKPNRRLEERQAKEVLRQIVNGFKSIRAIGAVHRDLKAENLLIHNGVVKIADFGFSKILPAECSTSTVLGTLYTMAPEVIAKEKYGYQCDIWSIGIIYYCLLAGNYPYRGANYAEMLKNIRGTPLKFDQTVPMSENTRDFIKRCLRVDPKERITWAQIQAHPLLQSNLQQAPTPSVKQASNPRTKQFYIRNTGFLNIKNPVSFPDVQLTSQMTEERLNNPIERIIVQNRLYFFYQQIYLAVRDYIMSRLTFGVSQIEEFQNVAIEYHTMSCYIISRETLKQSTQLLDSLTNFKNIMQFKEMISGFFQSKECHDLVRMLHIDRQTLIKYTAKFKSKLMQADLQKLEVNESTRLEKVIQREKRVLIQFAIQLFNKMEMVEKRLATKILLLVKFLMDDVEGAFKDPALYASFLASASLKDLWLGTRDKLTAMSINYA